MMSALPATSSNDSLVVVEGVVSGLQRTSHVSGGSGDTAAHTTHICLFSIGSNRVELSLPMVAPIADGDTVRIAGSKQPGLFSAIACRNLTTGWTSAAKGQGCGIAFGIFFACFGLLFAGVAFTIATGIGFAGGKWFAILPVLMGIAGLVGTIWVASYIIRQTTKRKRAHEMIA